MTKEEAISLKRGQIIYHLYKKNADGTPQRFRVIQENTPLSGVYAEIRVKLRRGLHESEQVDGLNYMNFTL